MGGWRFRTYAELRDQLRKDSPVLATMIALLAGSKLTSGYLLGNVTSFIMGIVLFIIMFLLVIFMTLESTEKPVIQEDEEG